MNINNSKRNVVLGVLTGGLVGFVLGVAFGIPVSELKACKESDSGDIARISNIGRLRTKPLVQEENAESDTVRYDAVGEDGDNLEIIIIK